MANQLKEKLTWFIGIQNTGPSAKRSSTKTDVQSLEFSSKKQILALKVRFLRFWADFQLFRNSTKSTFSKMTFSTLETWFPKTRSSSATTADWRRRRSPSAYSGSFFWNRSWSANRKWTFSEVWRAHLETTSSTTSARASLLEIGSCLPLLNLKNEQQFQNWFRCRESCLFETL